MPPCPAASRSDRLHRRRLRARPRSWWPRRWPAAAWTRRCSWRRRAWRRWRCCSSPAARTGRRWAALPLLLVLAWSALQVLPLAGGRAVSLDPPASGRDLATAVGRRCSPSAPPGRWPARGAGARWCWWASAPRASPWPLVVLGAALLGLGPLLEPKFPFVNPNHLAGFLALTAFPVLGLALRRHGQARLLWLMGFVVVVAPLFLSLSRGGIGAFFGGVAVFLLLSTRRERRRRRAAPPLALGGAGRAHRRARRGGLPGARAGGARALHAADRARRREAGALAAGRSPHPRAAARRHRPRRLRHRLPGAQDRAGRR